MHTDHVWYIEIQIIFHPFHICYIIIKWQGMVPCLLWLLVIFRLFRWKIEVVYDMVHFNPTSTAERYAPGHVIGKKTILQY